jgi:hypothetical protein
VTVVSALLGGLAVALALANVVVYQWVSFVPRLGVRTLYHAGRLRYGVATLALGCAVAAGLRGHTRRRWLPLAAVLALTPLAGALHAPRLLTPLDDPEHVGAADADATVDGDELVLGIELDGQAHAWQVRTLVPHHLVHDAVAGRPVVATWCAVCNTGIVYDGTVAGRSLHFDPEGVWRRNMVMRDRETGTLWQQSTGEGLVGPLAEEDLTVLGGRLLTWDAWRADHPETTLTRDDPAVWRGVLPRDFTVRMLVEWGLPTRVTPPGLAPHDDRLDPLADVVGLQVDGQPVAYPLELLAERGTVEDEVAGSRVVVGHAPTTERVTVTVDGEEFPHRRTRWLEWSEFHPETGRYG